jgi:hypothetical protein
VTSISPNSSPSQRSPPHKKLKTSFQPSFSITPPQFDTEDQAVFDGLYENVARSWTQHYRTILNTSFQRDTWESNFRTLGMSNKIIDMIRERLDELEREYSESVVWTMFGMESTGSMASIVLEIEVYHYSTSKLCLNRTSEDADDYDDDDESLPRAETPSPPSNQATTMMALDSFQSQASRDIGNDDASHRENGGKKTEEDGSANESESQNTRESSDKEQEGLGNSGEEDTDNDDSDDAALDTEDLESKIRKYLIDTDLHAKQVGVTIYFAGNPPLTVSPEYLPQSTFIDIPAQDSIELFHGCAVVDPNLDNLFCSLDSFLTYGPIIMRQTSPIPRYSYLSRLPAVYYSTSVIYGRLWPTLKKGFAEYRRIRKVGTEYTLIAVSKVSGDIFNGSMARVTCGRIPQHDVLLAKNASSSTFCSLMFDQFANRNLSKARNGRKPIRKDNPSTASADIITSPLPSFEQEHLRMVDIGKALDQITPVKNVTIVAGCTGKGATCLGSGIYSYVIYGFGEGSLGYGTQEKDWGTAFTVAPFVLDENSPPVP